MRTMMLCTALLGLGLVACAADTENGQLGGRTVSKEMCPTGCSSTVEQALATNDVWDKIDDGVYVTHDDERIDDPCALLPSTGLCSQACNPDVMVRMLPAGQCMDISCNLSDRGVIVAGGCATQGVDRARGAETVDQAAPTSAQR